MSTRVGIVGIGYVGKAMLHLFKDHYDTYVYDIQHENDFGFSTKEQINECDVGIVCVPTPMAEDGSCDVTIVKEVIEWLNTPLIIIKSTIEPGTVDRFKQTTGKHIVFSPEFCGESSYWSPYPFDTDVKETPFFIFGGSPEDTEKCVSLYVPIVGPTKAFRQTTALNSELTKYMENTFFASKIIFANEIERICNAAGGNFNEVRSLWMLDPRVDPMHTAVFPESKTPYGGKCLPKDLSALVEYARSIGYEPEFLAEIQRSNERIGKLRNVTEADRIHCVSGP